MKDKLKEFKKESLKSNILECFEYIFDFLYKLPMYTFIPVSLVMFLYLIVSLFTEDSFSTAFSNFGLQILILVIVFLIVSFLYRLIQKLFGLILDFFRYNYYKSRVNMLICEYHAITENIKDEEILSMFLLYFNLLIEKEELNYIEKVNSDIETDKIGRDAVSDVFSIGADAISLGIGAISLGIDTFSLVNDVDIYRYDTKDDYEFRKRNKEIQKENKAIQKINKQIEKDNKQIEKDNELENLSLNSQIEEIKGKLENKNYTRLFTNNYGIWIINFLKTSFCLFISYISWIFFSAL